MSTHDDTGRAAIRNCPKCGQPGGLIFCPICHGPRTDEPIDTSWHSQDIAGAEDGVGGVFSDAEPGL